MTLLLEEAAESTGTSLSFSDIPSSYNQFDNSSPSASHHHTFDNSSPPFSHSHHTFTFPGMNTYSRGSIHFPLPGSRQAPRTFKGRYNEVKTFVAHYERLCAQYSVSSARERLDNIGQYCARSTREFMEALDSFRDGDWDQFVLDLL